MPTSLIDFMGYVPLTKMVETVPSGIPNPLGDRLPKLFTLTENILGNKFSRVTFSGTRKLARNNPYMGQARDVQKQPFGEQDLAMLTPKEYMTFGSEFLDIYRHPERWEPQKLRAMEIIKKQSMQLKILFDSFRVAAVHSLFGQRGNIYLDTEGYLMNTSVGADLVVNGRVPDANVGNVGGFFSASWASASTDIVSSVRNFKTFALQQSNRRITKAIYGKNIVGYVTANTTMQAYLARNSAKNDQFVTSGEIPDGVLDLEWIPVQDAYFNDNSDTTREIFPADQVTFTPEIDANVYTMYIGSTAIPKNFGLVTQDAAAALPSALADVQGMASYSMISVEPFQIKQMMVDCFLPNLTVPNAFFFVDTTP